MRDHSQVRDVFEVFGIAVLVRMAEGDVIEQAEMLRELACDSAPHCYSVGYVRPRCVPIENLGERGVAAERQSLGSGCGMPMSPT